MLSFLFLARLLTSAFSAVVLWCRAPGLRSCCTLPWRKVSGSFSRTVTWHPAGCPPWRDSLKTSTRKRSDHMHTHTSHYGVVHVRPAFIYFASVNTSFTFHNTPNRCTRTSVCGSQVFPATSSQCPFSKMGQRWPLSLPRESRPIFRKLT